MQKKTFNKAYYIELKDNIEIYLHDYKPINRNEQKYTDCFRMIYLYDIIYFC